MVGLDGVVMNPSNPIDDGEAANPVIERRLRHIAPLHLTKPFFNPYTHIIPFLTKVFNSVEV